MTPEQEKRQQAIIERGDAVDAYRFARDVEGADVNALQAVVVERGNGWDTYQFARDIEGADIDALQRVVLERGGGRHAYLFARDIEGADVAALQQVVIERGDGYYAYLFARDIEGADIDALQDVVIERGDGWDAYRFARDIEGADREGPEAAPGRQQPTPTGARVTVTPDTEGEIRNRIEIVTPGGERIEAFGEQYGDRLVDQALYYAIEALGEVRRETEGA